MHAAAEGGAFTFDRLLGAVMGNRVLAERVARECLKLMPSLQARLTQALAQQQRKDLAEVAHQLRGMAATMGATQLASAATTLEAGAVNAPFERLVQQHAQVIEAWRVVEAVFNAQVAPI